MLKATKKITAAILSAVLVMSCAGTAFADGSPVGPDDPKPGYQEIDTKNQDTSEVKVSEDGETIAATAVEDKKTVDIGGTAKMETVEGGTGRFPVNALGTEALKDNKNTTTVNLSNTITTVQKNALVGSKVKTVNSTVAKGSSITLEEDSMKKSKVKNVNTQGKGTTVVEKNSFKKTSVKNLNFNTSKVTFEEGSVRYIAKGTKTTISLTNITKVSDVTCQGRVFGPRSELFTIELSKDKISDKEFANLKKMFREAGYLGKIKRV
jgi:hypothetical protein